MTILTIPLLNQKEFERFCAKIVIGNENDCWPWVGAMTSKGYGRVRIGDSLYLAHRVAYALEVKRDIRGVVMHSCDNPPCCNPRHLADASRSANSRDMAAKGRSSKSPDRDDHPRAKLTSDQVREIQEDPRTDRALAPIYGVSKSLISSVRMRRN